MTYNYYGIRTLRHDEECKIGAYCRNSYDWDHENDCSSEVELNGTCCTEIESPEITVEEISNVHKYGNGNIVIVAGDSREYGEDDGEIIIRNAVIVKILKEVSQ